MRALDDTSSRRSEFIGSAIRFEIEIMKDRNDAVRATDALAPVVSSQSEAPGPIGPASLERGARGAPVVEPRGTRWEALDYVIDQEQRLITITGGYADAEEWKMLLSRVLNDPRHETGFAFLRDLRRASTPLDPERVPRVIEAIRGFWPYLQPSRGAVLTAGGSETVALAADALAISHRLPVRMFDSYQAAVTWLQSGA